MLRPGRTCAVLNIPLWAIRHFLYMEKVLSFQSWIVWDALSFPVRFIMPAHYTILCFSRGLPRPLPGLSGEAGMTESTTAPDTFKSLEPLAEGFCLRSSCVKKRDAMHIDDRAADTVWPPLGDVCGSPTPPPGRRWCGRVSRFAAPPRRWRRATQCGGRLARSCPAASWRL